MSNWIEAHQALLSHPKTKRLMRSLTATPNETLGILTRLWWFTMEYAPDGDLGDFSSEDIAEAVGWEGDPVALVAGLQNPGPNKDAHGFLDDMLVHDWDQYGGKLYRKREQDAERKRESRQRDSVPPSHGRPTDGARTAHVEDRTGQDRQDKEPLVESPPQNGVDSTPSPVDNPKKDGRLAKVREVFAYWQRATGKTSHTLTQDRTRAIRARLVEGIAPETIMQAVDAAMTDPWWNGKQDGEWKADIKTICGKGSTVEKLADTTPANNNGHAPPSTLVRPETVARLRAMVAQGDNPEDLRASCASDAEYAAVIRNCSTAKEGGVG